MKKIPRPTVFERFFGSVLFVLVFSCLYVFDGFSQAPRLINFQAQISNESSAQTDMVFALYDVSEGGEKIWEETHNNVDVVDGAISVLLGSSDPFEDDVFNGEGDRYLEITVDGIPLEPRFQITSVAFAIRANTADHADTADQAGTADQLNSPFVLSLNGLSDQVTLVEGDNVKIELEGQSVKINAIVPDTSVMVGGIESVLGGAGIAVANSDGPSPEISIAEESITDDHVKDGGLSKSSLATGTAVLSLNGVTDDVTLVGGVNVDVQRQGQSLVLNAVVEGGGVQAINAGAGIAVANAEGPIATIGIANNSITDTQIQDGSISRSSLASGAAVFSLNGLKNDVTITSGQNVDVDVSNQSIVINATGDGVGVSRVNGGQGIFVSNSDGPTATVSIQNNSITDTQIQDRSVTGGSLALGTVGSQELNNQVVLGWDGKLDIQNSSGQTRGTFSTVNGNGFLAIDKSDGRDGVTIEVLSSSFGMVTVHGIAGNIGTRIWGDQTGTGLFGAAMAVFKRDGDHSSTWIRTEGTSASNAWGVIGISNGNNTEVIRLDGRNGDVSISGNLSKGSGSFKIDHPLDPQNKYLSHSFVESPDMMNIYNGNVILDDQGEAWVEMPDWFEALNRDFRYQLTCIGGFAQVYIANEIENRRFKIAGGAPGLKVSWQVTGIRQDPFAEKNRIQVEEEKSPEERGTYMHPSAYGN